MGDGFGAGIAFRIEDNAGIDNDIGYLRVYRAGADNKGAFKITLNNAGPYIDVILITPAGVVQIPNLTASRIMMTDASSNLTTTTDLPTATTIGSAYIYRVSGTDVAVADGGTNISSYAVGDLLYASAAGVLSKLADVATGSYLASGGVGTAPAWATLNQAAVAGLKTSDSPGFVTVKCSNLSDGTIPYHVDDATGLADTLVTVTELNYLQGATSNIQDQIDGFVGLFEIDIDGNLMPVTDSVTDQYYELDDNDDIMPKAA